MKTVTALFLYATALIMIYGGFSLAPDMTWPHTDVELFAALLLTMGMLTKLAGHVVLFSTAHAR